MEKEFRDWKEHENAVKAQLRMTTKKLQNRCLELQKQLASAGRSESHQSPGRVTNVGSIDDIQSYVAHVNTTQVQMQDRIDRLTSLLMEERQARRAAQDTTRSFQKSLEDVAAQTAVRVRESHLQEYLTRLHSQLDSLRDTVILLKNDNNELIHQRDQIQMEKNMVRFSRSAS